LETAQYNKLPLSPPDEIFQPGGYLLVYIQALGERGQQKQYHSYPILSSHTCFITNKAYENPTGNKN